MHPDIAIILIVVVILTPSLPFMITAGFGIFTLIVHLLTCEVCRNDAKRLIISRFKRP